MNNNDEERRYQEFKREVLGEEVGGALVPWEPIRVEEEDPVEEEPLFGEEPVRSREEPSREEIEKLFPDEEVEGKKPDKLAEFIERRRKEKLAKTVKEAEKKGLKLERQIYSTKMAQFKAEERKARGSRARRFGKDVAGISGGLYRIGTLGGPVKFQKKELYFPTEMKRTVDPGTLRSMRELTTPIGLSGMRGLTSMQRREGKRLPAGEALAPQLGTLRTLTSPSSMKGSPLAQMIIPSARLVTGKGDRSLERMRKLTFPKGLSSVEKEVYREIRENGDVDVPSHITEELLRLGIPRGDARRAIGSLLKKQVIRKGERFGKEQVLEVTR